MSAIPASDNIAAKRGAFHEIPIIDFADAYHKDLAMRRALARKIYEACVRVGFFYVKNHGVDATVMQNVFSAARDFFALPREEKMEIDLNKSAHFRGYTKLMGENVNPESRGDVHEGFDFGVPCTSIYAPNFERTDEDLNVWPTQLGEPFKKSIMEYYEAVTALGRKLSQIFALSLDLEETYFDRYITLPAVIARILYYPPQTGEVDMKELGIGAHSDYELFTILAQDDDISALQVKNRDGEWIHADPIPGTFVINIADCMARWTNDVFQSTIHRAINRSGVERYSVPMFFGVDYECTIETLPSCVNEDRPAKYKAVVVGDWVRSRLEGGYNLPEPGRMEGSEGCNSD